MLGNNLCAKVLCSINCKSNFASKVQYMYVCMKRVCMHVCIRLGYIAGLSSASKIYIECVNTQCTYIHMYIQVTHKLNLSKNIYIHTYVNGYVGKIAFLRCSMTT